MALALAFVGYVWLCRPKPMAATQIFRGVTYTCQPLDPGGEGTGLLQLITVDLTTPGLELFIPPTDRSLADNGDEYRLSWTPWVAWSENLSVTVNGTLYRAAWPHRMPGARGQSTETIVANHAVNHVDPNSYLLWFEDDLTPHLEPHKPPPAAALAKAKWGIGGQADWISNGGFNPCLGHEPLRGTYLGINPDRKLLFIAVFDNASTTTVANMLAKRGVTDLINVDSGASTSLTIGSGAAGIWPRTTTWPHCGNANQFGIRAPKLTP
jgi:hypothetical protein